MPYTYEVDVEAIVRTCAREGCGNRFIETVKGRTYCTDSCRTMVWQAQNPDRVKGATARYQKKRRAELRDKRDEMNRQISAAGSNAG